MDNKACIACGKDEESEDNPLIEEYVTAPGEYAHLNCRSSNEYWDAIKKREEKNPYNMVYADLTAVFTMLPKEVSGWESPVTSNLRPNHNFYGPECNTTFIGSVDVLNDEWIHPGESKEVFLKMLLPEKESKKLKPGFTWRVQAGSRHFANIEVVELIEIKKPKE